MAENDVEHAENDTGISRQEPRRKTISNAYVHRLQRRHFLLFDVLPIFGTAAAFAFLAVHPFGAPELVLLLTMWIVTGLGISVRQCGPRTAIGR